MLLFLFSVLKAYPQVASHFTASAVYGCPPLVVNFTDQSTGGPTSYYWDFDNGNTSSLQNPSTSYPLPGVYNVLHIVSNGSSLDTSIMQIRVFQPPTDSFTSVDQRGCNNPCHTVHFTNLTIPGESPVVDYVWDFGDGSLPQQAYNASHCYNRPGTFQVTLVSRDSNGCQTSKIVPNYVTITGAPTASMTSSPSSACNPPLNVHFTGTGSSPNGPVSYAWYFGDGNTSALQNPNNNYTTQGIFTPMLLVSDTTGCIDTARGNVAITPVHAGFTANTVNGCMGIPVQFTDTSNYAQTWSWDFGDGNTSTLQNPSHAYATNGSYTVKLTVTYNNCTDTHTETAFINVTQPINFTLNASNTTSCSSPFTTTFSSTASGATSYLWDFGDSTATSTAANPTHTYTTDGSYTVTLSVTNSSGCVNTQSFNNYITIGGIQASFTYDSLNGCSPLIDHFRNTSTSTLPITSYQWFFGDGSSANTQNPTHSYSNAGVFMPMLIITNSAGCKDTAIGFDSIRVGHTLKPDFVATPLIQCVDQQISFFDSTQGVGPQTTFLWEFGDGSTSYLENPNHFYSDTGYFDIKLVVINQGCPSDTVRKKYVHIVVPRAQFLYKFSCSSPTTVSFIDTSEGANTWLWEFGDGSTSTQRNPTHNYSTPGNYNVTLIVSNFSTGCVDSTKQTLLVGTPNAVFSATPLTGCAPLIVQFHDSSAFASGWLWKFGDGQTSAQKNPAHIYADTGTYTVTLIINPQGSCTDSVKKVNYITVYGIKPNIYASPTIGCAPLHVQFADSSTSYHGSVVSWLWTFGLNDTSNISNPTHTYDTAGAYVARVRMIDSHGCEVTTSKIITPKNLIADFTADTVLCPGASVHCNNLSQNANSYFWDFGDGNTSTTAAPAHTYTNSGLYTLSLISYNTNWGCSDTMIKLNYVNVDTPAVDFYVLSSFAPCPPFPVQFYNSSSYRPGLTWQWFFGDGDTSSVKEPLHVYFFPGDYDVTLIAKDSFGCTGSKKYIDMIRVRGPIGHFQANPDTGCAPLTISISGTVQSTVNIFADFGDGSTSHDTLNIQHTYMQPGNFYPVYTLTDSLGCHVAYPVDTVVVGLIPYPNLTDTSICKGNYVSFDLTLGDHFSWTTTSRPPYLDCDTCKHVLCTSPDTVTYIVTATTNLGCKATDTVTVNVDPLPQIFPGLSFRLCVDDTLQLSAGPGVKSAKWTPDIAISDTNSVNPRVWPTDTMTYRVTGSNTLGCAISRIVRVWPITRVTSSLSVSDTVTCQDNKIGLGVTVLDANYSGDTTYFWTPARYLNATNIPNPSVTAPPGNYIYNVIVKSGHCTADTGKVHVNVVSVPDVEAGDNETVAAGTQVQLYAASHQDVDYKWTPTVDSFSCTDCRRPYVTVNQTQTVFVTAENHYGCKTIDSVLLKVVECDPKAVFIPNTFTPNGDGLNDKLFVRGSGLRHLEYFRVFDRWGKLVYDSHNFEEGWDGTIAGKPADQAVYVYMVRGGCSSGSTVDLQGNVTLIR